MKIADSSFLIALFDRYDQYHSQAKELQKIHPNIAITSVILWETVEYFIRKEGNNSGTDAGKRIFDSKIPVLETDLTVYKNSLDVMEKYNQLSYCDAISVTVLASFKEKQIISFDSDFDLVPGIERIY
ncbi:MAG: type II toxin-antitoxin system VapC family toxin [Candidatus Micrarchaeia archaeon]|jgi:predicted nucleic acid-binding protein